MTTYLQENLQYLKEVFEEPRMSLSKYFSNLRNEVDLAFVKKIDSLKTEDEKASVNSNWTLIIDRINAFEQDCLNHMIENKFEKDLDQLTRKSIQDIENKLEIYKNTHKEKPKSDEEQKDEESTSESDSEEEPDELFIEIDDLIYDALFDLQRVLFLNKTMFFLLFRQESFYNTYSSSFQYNFYSQFPNAKMHKTVNIFKKMEEATSVGKLIIITNRYCGKYATKLFESFEFQGERLTRDIVVTTQLKSRLENNINLITNHHIDEFTYDNTSIIIGRSLMEAVYFNHNSKTLRIDPKIFEQNGDQCHNVHLDHNEILQIPANFFVCLPNLIQLSLGSCELNFIAKGAFNGLVNLKMLYLGHNKLRNINSNIFEGLDNVEEICMQSNKYLCNVSSDLCKGLNKLIKLDMANCSLRRVSLDMLNNLNNLPCFKCFVMHSGEINVKRENKEFIESLEASKKYKFDIV